MMPVIRVSDEVVNILKKYAIPLEDTHDSVLRRILGKYDELFSGPSTRFIRGRRTIEQVYAVPGVAKYPRPHIAREARWIINALNLIGGSANAGDVVNFIEKIEHDMFTDEDLENLPSGDLRWIKKVHWARFDMVKGGLLNPNAPRGVWELTEKGRTFYTD